MVGVVQGVGNEESGDSVKSTDSEILTNPTQIILLAPKAALQQQVADFPTQVDFSLQIALERNVPHLACKV